MKKQGGKNGWQISWTNWVEKFDGKISGKGGEKIVLKNCFEKLCEKFVKKWLDELVRKYVEK